MPERILIGVAWPYANGPLHLGHLAGAYLPADIFARYHRARGSEVLMVSGSDQHGTPITIRAEQEGVSPQQVVDRYHSQFLDCWERLGISFDLFTTTGTANHAAMAQEIFSALYQKGYIYKDTMLLPYCPTCKRFLADRYIVGTCPVCGYADARGDQCDNCGSTLDPKDLKEPRCRISGDTPDFLESEHFFLKLTAFQEQLLNWVRQQTHWRPSVLNFTTRFLEGGLKDRAVTRDLDWGVPVPIPGYDSKRIYVWFEAVIGYLSASMEHSQAIGKPQYWEKFWKEECRVYNFLGKDNIPFHTIIWPAMLMGYGGLNLPYDVPANEFLTFESQQFSTSRNWGVWVSDYLDRFEPDPLRYYLSANMPETSDSDFSWREYLRRNNDELVATYGNLVHRVLTLTHRHFEGRVPEPQSQDEIGLQLLVKAEEHFVEAGQYLEGCRFRMGITSLMGLAREANRYLDATAPWRLVKEDIFKAASCLWTALTVINCLKTGLYPYLPYSSEKLHKMLGFQDDVRDHGWVWSPNLLPPGQPLGQLEPLFTKLDDSIIERETQRLGV
ncbi:MAG: methionine--tRNA ligase [Chloroflexi bacterium]|nr:methionine--tRNA ligase [Chloroflexota bacterium]